MSDNEKTEGTSDGGDTLRAVAKAGLSATGAKTRTDTCAASSPGGQRPTAAPVPRDDLEDLFECKIPDCPDCAAIESGTIPTCGDPDCLNLDCLEGTHLAPAGSESLVPFVFSCRPNAFDRSQFVDSHPNGSHAAFWEGDDLIVADMTSNATFKVICYEQQRRASSRAYYTWYCSPVGPGDPATAEYMRGISS